MLSVFVGRVIRYMITAILTIKYGPEIVNIAARLATQHRIALSVGVIAFLALLVYWIWRTMWKRRGKKDGTLVWSWRAFPSEVVAARRTQGGTDNACRGLPEK